MVKILVNQKFLGVCEPVRLYCLLPFVKHSNLTFFFFHKIGDPVSVHDV